MANRTGLAMGQLVSTLRSYDADSQTDGQLLGRFFGQRDEAAFAALVRRHGSMVLGVCRRILGNVVDAEDAFQATFLILVRKAGALRSRAVLGDWLHGVARRTALKAKGAAAHRWLKEQAMARPLAKTEEPRDDWLPLLDEELSCIPEKYRLPIVLCDLEGRTRQEAAKRLGWPEGTVAGRLARARTMLAKRLTRRGVMLSSGALSAALASNGASACVPAVVLSNTIKAACLLAAGQAVAESVISAKVAHLTGEVMKAMLLNKLKLVATVVVVGLLSCAGWMAYSSFGQEPAKVIQGAGVEAKDRKDNLPNQDQKPVAEQEDRELKKGEREPNKPDNVPRFPTAVSQALIKMLREPMDMRDFQNPMTLKDAVDLIYDKFAAKGKELPILVDWIAFKEDAAGLKDVNETLVSVCR